jgi:predicted amidohydrolase
MNVTIAAAQYPITKHKNFAAWCKHTEGWVADAVQQQAQVLLLPEYGSMELVSIFTKTIQKNIQQQVKELQILRGGFCNCFEELAKKYHLIIVAPSFPVMEGDSIFNRVYAFSPKGLVGYQDKFFMTRFENEEWGINAANPKKLALFEAEWGSFGIQICYDVEFGFGSQILNQAGASLILAPSCTETIRGATRVHIGARARALENQSYTVVAQTIGNAPWSPAVDVNYGFAAFYCTPDKNLPEQGIITQKEPQTVGWLVETLDFTKLETVRNDGQVFNFKDHKKVKTQLEGEYIELVRYHLD